MDAEHDGIGLSEVIAAVENLGAGFRTRVGRWAEAGADWDRFSASVQASFGGVPQLFGAMALVAVVTVGTFAAILQLVRQRLRPDGTMGSLGALLVALLAASLVGGTLARVLSSGAQPVQFSLMAAAICAGLACMIWHVHGGLILSVRDHERTRVSQSVRRLARNLNLVLAWGMLSTASFAMFGAWRVGGGFRDLLALTLLGLPVVLGIIMVVFLHRKQIAALIGGPRPRSVFRGALARRWPGILIVLILLLYLSSQIAITVGKPIPSLTLLTAVLALLSVPYVDCVLRRWSQSATSVERLSTTRVALRRTARPAAMVTLLTLVLSVWLAPLFLLSGSGMSRIAWLAFEIAMIGLVSAFAWNLVLIASDRVGRMAAGADAGDDEIAAPRTRFETLAPLLAATMHAIIAVLAVLSILVALGVSVLPIITGLGVFGIAIGFGSQTLVKDIVSGLFFLADDAFRMGEYIETPGAKGTVEKISLRSVSLRHHRGPLATIPYGSIGRVLNFSRDYVIEKIAFRVALDTDVENLRKIFKKIGLEIAADPDVADDLLEPFKSQGIAEVEDGTLLVRGKFKAKAGRQHMIRRKVMLAVHKAFLEHNIQAVARPVTATAAK